VVGEIDLLTAPQLRERLLTLPDGDLVLDISGVRLLAAAGLRTMLDLQNRRGKTGAQMVLAAPTAPVRRILGITRLEQTLPTAATVQDAVALVRVTAPREGRQPRSAASGSPPA